MERRAFLRDFLRGLSLAGLGGLVGFAVPRASSRKTVWQIDPDKCVCCGRCATECVLPQSAVKCVHVYAMCGYCELCTGYFEPAPHELDTGAENQLCPAGAIIRNFVEDPYYSYTIDEDLCNGCAKCVKGCNAFGNGSLFLQVRHNLCLDCNECGIAKKCPAQAIRRVPADQPYLLKEVIAPCGCITDSATALQG